MANLNENIINYIDDALIKICEGNRVTEIDYKNFLKKLSLLTGSGIAFTDFLYECMKLVGDEVELERAFILEYRENTKELNLLSNWSKYNFDLNNIYLFSQDTKEIMKLFKVLEDEGSIIINNINNIEDSSVRNLLKKYKLKSLLTVAFYIDSSCHGVVGFGQVSGPRIWRKSEIHLILALSIVLSQSFKKHYIEKKLYEEKEQLRMTVLSIVDGVITTDKLGKIKMLNHIAEKMIGWSLREASGKELEEIFIIKDKRTLLSRPNIVKEVLRTGKSINRENNSILVSKDCTERSITECASPITDQYGTSIGTVLVFTDITEKVKSDEQIKVLSRIDSITGLYNRSYFEELLDEINQEHNLPISIIIGDLNGLKMTNDVFGHQAGDKRLRLMGQVIREVCTDRDLAARWGGDEVLIVSKNTSEKQAEEICKSIKSSCSKVSVDILDLSISLGHATKRKVGESFLDILKKAELHMYRKKLLERGSFRSSIITSMQNTLFERSHETEKHGERLKEICKKIGEQMNLSSNKIDDLQLLSTLHDIGKIAVKDSVLLKTGKLTDEEWNEMKGHSESGYRIINSVPELYQIAEYVLYHHERWDGQGYPEGLAGENIPLLSRILAVADAYDAMTNDRSYRKALSPEKAKGELEINSGKQFDPYIVDIFLNKVLN